MYRPTAARRSCDAAPLHWRHERVSCRVNRREQQTMSVATIRTMVTGGGCWAQRARRATTLTAPPMRPGCPLRTGAASAWQRFTRTYPAWKSWRRRALCAWRQPLWLRKHFAMRQDDRAPSGMDVAAVGRAIWTALFLRRTCPFHGGTGSNGRRPATLAGRRQVAVKDTGARRY